MFVLILIGIILSIIGSGAIGFSFALAALDEQYRAEKQELESWRQKSIAAEKRLELVRRDLGCITELYGDLLQQKSQTTTFAEVG